MGRMRSVARDVVAVSDQLQSFSFSRATCSCCSWQHKHPDTGNVMKCDREHIYSVLTSCFGSVDIAEEFVRSVIRPSFVVNVGLPYRKVLLAGLPFVWLHVTAFGRYMSTHDGDSLVHLPCADGEDLFDLFVFRAGIFLFYYPMSMEITLRIGAYFKERDSRAAVDAIRTVLATSLVVIALGVLSWAEMMTRCRRSIGAMGTISQIGIRVIVSLLVWGRRPLT
eukprot:TRINITY_DN10055_c0_g1_i11.p1 TRINITY_DN10055_c0_g1~~TRINITY_DN10055_c0_g1_i11.p1  ORF type:complete len:247 (+),score=15.81 TRINITY_DN10055_c0_g1_i11:73-741(+)